MSEMVKWRLESIEASFISMSYGDTAKMVESLKTTLEKYQKAVDKMTVKNEEALRRIEMLETLIKKHDKPTMEKVLCHNCSTFLLLADDQNHIGIQVENAGFIYKLPILYGGKEPLYFCSNECKDVYYEKTYSLEARQKASIISREIKEEIPAMVKDTVEATKQFIKQFKKLQNGKED